MSNYEQVLQELFGEACWIDRDNEFLAGHAELDRKTIAICGTCDRAYIGVDIAHRLAGFVLDVIRTQPGRPILMLVDNLGHRLSRRDELLANNGYLAHLGECMELARISGHRVISLVYGEAVSGGFLATGMSAEACYALEGGQVRVMNLPAMARITRLPQEQLEELCRESAIFAPGVENFVKMGALEQLWKDGLADHLTSALAAPEPALDRRRTLGLERGGRVLAASVSARVRGPQRG